MSDEEIQEATQEITDDIEHEQHESEEHSHHIQEEVHHVEEQALEAIGQAKDEVWTQMLNDKMDQILVNQVEHRSQLNELNTRLLTMEISQSSESNKTNYQNPLPNALAHSSEELEEESKAIAAAPIAVAGSDEGDQKEAKTTRHRSRFSRRINRRT